MKFKLFSTVFIFLCVVHVACGQARPAQKAQEEGIPGPPAPRKMTETVEDVSAKIDRSRLKKQAGEMTAAFVARNFERMADLTYPDLLELLGGKGNMVSQLKKEVSGWDAAGFQILAIPVDEPKQVVKSRDYLLAVVPVTMRVKMGKDVLTQKSSYIGVSRDDGQTWTFVGGRLGNKQRLKVLFASVPSAVDKLELQEETPPVPEREQ
jgi:hypothetical protein